MCLFLPKVYGRIYWTGVKNQALAISISGMLSQHSRIYEVTDAWVFIFWGFFGCLIGWLFFC